MFEPAPNLKNRVLSLRPLVQIDFDGLFFCAGDPRVWAGHPSKERYKRKNFEQWFLSAVNCGNVLVVIDNKTEKIIGSTRFYFDAIPVNEIAMGYTFLAYEYWGGETNYHLKSLMLNHAFASYSSVWMHIDATNIRSQKAALKLGAEHIKDELISLGNNQPALYRFYKISQEICL